MRTRTLLAIAVAAFIVSFTSCTKENAGVKSSDEMTQLSVRIHGAVSTRAVELSGSNVAGTIQIPSGGNHSIFVISPQGNVIEYVDLDADEVLSASGQVLPVSVRADSRVYIICNIPNDDAATIQALTTFGAIQSAISAIATQTDYTEVTLANVTGVPVGFTAINGEATVNITIGPLVSRLELVKVQAAVNSVGDIISTFSVTGVYVDDYYPEFTYTGGGSGTPFTQGQSTEFYGIGDAGDWIASGTPLAAMPDDNKIWAHQVVSKGVPRFIIRLEDVKYIPNGGSEIALSDTYYLTVKGYTFGGNPVTNLERGKIYRIGANNGITFTYDDLSLTPNPVDINLNVMVSIQEWMIDEPDVILGTAVKSLAVIKQPTYKSYLTGSEFDPTGMVVTATLENNTTQTINVTQAMLDYDFSTVGEKTVTITYNGKTVQVTGITVGESADIIYFAENGTLQVGKWGSEVNPSNLALFPFGSVVGITSIKEVEGWDNSMILFNPTDTDYEQFYDIPNYKNYDNYENLLPSVSSSVYHNGANVRKGLGDPCKLVGLSLSDIFKSDGESVNSHYSGWRLPTDIENSQFVGGTDPRISYMQSETTDVEYYANYWVYSEKAPVASNGIRLAGAWFPVVQGDTPNNTGTFIPAAGFRIIDYHLYQGSYGFYWSSNGASSHSGKHLHFFETEVYPNEELLYENAYPIRCVPQVYQ